jgi:exonuclease SbcC
MDDKEQEKKMGLPPLPPGFMKPGSPQPPPLPGGNKPALPPQLPGGGAPAFPFARPQGFSAPAAPQQPQRDAAAEESARMREDKDKLEKKIVEMEKVVSQEKEKALLAVLKNQQDEALSSKVESSLHDIQDKLRRDRHEQEVQEERITLKSKIKDLETRLVSERETWMQTLKGQINERETQSKDVEGHFIYRLQEMERRWLEEKAQWQRTISQKEDEVRSLKGSSEKLRETEDEFRRASMEKEMQAREISKLKDEVAKIDREKATIEAYLKNIPEREREFSDMRAENAGLRAREESARNENKLAEEKFRFEMDKMSKEVGRLQSEIGAISDRKNAEKDEELRKLQTRYEFTLQEKEKAVADVTGEKVRALSELVKMKGFVSRVQAINAVLEKERQGLRLEKMQMAQAMASNIEDVKRFKAEMEMMKASHQNELEGMMRRYQAEIQKFKEDHAAQFSAAHAQKIAEMQRRSEEDLKAAGVRSQEELARVKAAAAADLENRTLELSHKYETEIKDIRANAKIEMKQEYISELVRLKAEKAQAESNNVRLEAEVTRGSEESRSFDARLAAVRREADDAKVAMAENYRRLEAQFNSLKELKDDYERRFGALDADRARLATECSNLSAGYASLKTQLDSALAAKASREQELAVLAQNFKTESENRARFESELLFLKQKIQQFELQVQDAAVQIDAEKKNSAHTRDEAAKRAQADKARIAGITAALETYKQMEASFSGRMKWALKGKKEQK